MGSVGQILVKLETSFVFEVSSVALWCTLGVTWANMLVATQWPLKRAPPLHGSVWYGDVEAHWSFLRHADWWAAISTGMISNLFSWLIWVILYQYWTSAPDMQLVQVCITTTQLTRLTNLSRSKPAFKRTPVSVYDSSVLDRFVIQLALRCRRNVSCNYANGTVNKVSFVKFFTRGIFYS